MGHTPDFDPAMHNDPLPSPISSNILPETDADIMDEGVTETLSDHDIATLLASSQNLCDVGDLDESLLGLRKIIQANPNLSAAYALIGKILNLQKKYKAAEIALTLALKTLSSGADIQGNLLGNLYLELSLSLHQQNHFQSAALKAFQAIDHLPQSGTAQKQLATILLKMGLPKEALVCIQKSINLFSNLPDTATLQTYHTLYHMRAQANLQLNKTSAGFEDLCYAQHIPDQSDTDLLPPSVAPLNFQDKIVLIQAHGSRGESILLSRYLPLLTEQGALVTLEVPTPLKSLYQAIEGVEEVNALTAPQDQDQYDICLNLRDLPYHLNAQKTQQHPPASRFGLPNFSPHAASGSVLNVGLAWHNDDLQRNISEKNCFFDSLMSLIDIPHVKFHSLELPEHAKDLMQHGLHPMINDKGSNCKDNLALAHQILSLDLIISPDNEIAHLSASIGCPTWVLLSPDAHWAWGAHEPQTTWYPNARLFWTDISRNWVDVFHDVHTALTQQSLTYTPLPDTTSDVTQNETDGLQSSPATEINRSLSENSDDLIEDLSTPPIAELPESFDSPDMPVMSAEKILGEEIDRTYISPPTSPSPVAPLEQEDFIENKLAEILEEDASSEAIDEPGEELPNLADASDIPDISSKETFQPEKQQKRSPPSKDISTSPTPPLPPLDVLSLPFAFHNAQGHPRLTLNVDRDDLKDPDIITLCRQEADFGGYKYAVRAFLEAHLMPGDVFVDIGAHWGIFSLTAATKYPGEIKVLAVEPHPQNLHKFSNFIPDPLKDSIDIVSSALADKIGTGLLSPGTSMSHFITQIEDQNGTHSEILQDPPEDMVLPNNAGLACPITTLDSVLAARPDLHGRRIFLKMTANGAEPEILKGAEKLLSSGRVAAIIWQRSRAFDRNADRTRLLGMMQDLQSLGYRHYRLPHDILGGTFVPFLYGPELCSVFSIASDFTPHPAYTRDPGKYTASPRASATHLPETARGQWTELLKIAGTTDVGRWADPEILKEGATERAKYLAKVINPNQSLLDMGAGLMLLKEHMSDPDLYIPVDLLKWDSKTHVMDFNQSQFPTHTATQIVLSSCLEYLHHPETCLSSCKELGETLYLIYDTTLSAPPARRAMGYMNDLTQATLHALLQKCGWQVKEHKDLKTSGQMFICTHTPHI